MNHPGDDFLHLNRDGRWPGFAWHGLEPTADGELALVSLPAAVVEEGGPDGADLPPVNAPVNAPVTAPGTAGLAVAADGAVFWTRPGDARVFRRDPCDGHRGPLPADPDAGLAEPRGLAVHPGRGALLVADAGRRRVVMLALDGFQLLDVWDKPAPGSPFADPRGLAVDDAGGVYVADPAAGRVDRWSAGGTPSPAFHDRVAAEVPELARPVALAFGAGVLWVLDADTGALFRLAADGTPVAGGLPRLDLPFTATALALAGGALYAGDAAGRLLRLDPVGGRVLGAARGVDGPVAALAPGAGAVSEYLWLHPGGAGPRRLARTGASVSQGVLWGGPVTLGGRPHHWQRLRAVGELDGARVAFHVHASDGGPPPPEPAVEAVADLGGGFDRSAWSAVGAGAPDVLVHRRATHLWLGAVITAADPDANADPAAGAGTAPPPARLHQLRLSFDDEGLATHLPVIYRDPRKVDPSAPADSRETLERFLALFGGFFSDAEETIAALGWLFDPASAPAGWLDWLAGWLDYPLAEGWPEAKKRRLVAGAFDALRRRGTAGGLRRALADRLGVAAEVQEPHAETGWWVLPAADGATTAATAGARLGVDTVLVGAPAGGAVAGRTATVDRSHLVEAEDFGEPLFTGTAYRFQVRVPRSQVAGTADLERLRRLIDREKPAHTTYGICLTEPGVRLGVQSLLGVDTLLSGAPPSASRLGEASPGPVPGLVLGGRGAGRVGGGLGRTTRLGSGTVEPNVLDGAAGPLREETP